MKYLLLFLLFMTFTPKAFGVNCNVHKIYCKVLELRPDIDKKWAMKFSDIIYKKAKEYNLDPMISIAIVMQESSIRKINRKEKVLIQKETCDDLGECSMTYKVVTGYSDLSIWQFHIDTLLNFKIDPIRVQTDLEYATDFHFKLLKHKIKKCSKHKDLAWSCYHSATERHRLKYVEDVSRYLK